MPKNRITLKLLFFLVVTDFLETLTQYCFKKSAIPESSFMITKFNDVFFFLKEVVLSGFLWLGLGSVFITFVIWSTILSKIDLSVAVPICSFSYILVPLVSIFFLGEQMTFLDWTGIAFILTGVIIVSTSTKHKEIVIT
ncbi:MAG: EamA family transporter [Candidatus Omnitrophica bacterium]|nr:EamA family transporter [Candidatus Omnitrophota bacterium]MDD5653275.1 EamA family transporter [Candidatus Omnitrophota bacterium]